jgi:hypothetical protein
MTIDTINQTESTITCDLVPEGQCADFVDSLFGINFPLQLEPYVYAIASSLSSDYRGAYWHFQSLSNGGFYMSPDEDQDFNVKCESGYEGAMSADAFGMTCCMYAYSHLSFTAHGDSARIYARQYHALREYAMEHPEVSAIVAATD